MLQENGLTKRALTSYYSHIDAIIYIKLRSLRKNVTNISMGLCVK